MPLFGRTELASAPRIDRQWVYNGTTCASLGPGKISVLIWLDSLLSALVGKYHIKHGSPGQPWPVTTRQPTRSATPASGLPPTAPAGHFSRRPRRRVWPGPFDPGPPTLSLGLVGGSSHTRLPAWAGRSTDIRIECSAVYRSTPCGVHLGLESRAEIINVSHRMDSAVAPDRNSASAEVTTASGSAKQTTNPARQIR